MTDNSEGENSPFQYRIPRVGVYKFNLRVRKTRSTRCLVKGKIHELKIVDNLNIVYRDNKEIVEPDFGVIREMVMRRTSKELLQVTGGFTVNLSGKEEEKE